MHYLAAWDHDCSRFRGTIKEKCFICWLIINKPQPKQSIQETPLLKGHLPWCRGGPLNRGSTVGKKKSFVWSNILCQENYIFPSQIVKIFSSAGRTKRLDHTLNHWHFQKIPIFRFGGSKYTRLQKSCFFSFFFQNRIFKVRGVGVRFDSRAKRTRIFQVSIPLQSHSPLSLLLPVFRLASSSVLDLCTNTGSFTV